MAITGAKDGRGTPVSDMIGWLQVDDRDRNGQLLRAYLALFELTYLRILLAILQFQRWAMITFYRLVLGIDKRPSPRPTQAELRERYGR